MDERGADEEPIAGADGAGNRPIVAAMAMRAHLPPDGGHKIDLMDTTPSRCGSSWMTQDGGRGRPGSGSGGDGVAGVANLLSSAGKFNLSLIIGCRAIEFFGRYTY